MAYITYVVKIIKRGREFALKAKTYDFKTRTEILTHKNLNAGNVWPVALDIGYSGVKGFSPNKVFCFPSFAREKTPEMTVVGNPKNTDIFYRDEKGVEWFVGSFAQDILNTSDTNDSVNTLYNRNRYFSPMFLVLARVGIAIGLKENNIGKFDCEKHSLFLQTGLPPAYRKQDTPLLIEALEGHHEFSMKIGSGPWQNYAFDLTPQTIDVMDQPLGSVYSASKTNDGSTVVGMDGRAYVDSRMLVFDGGFGTLDVYNIINRSILGSNTFDELAMKAVFQKTCDEIMRRYGKFIPVHTIQPYLESGTISVLNRKKHSTEQYDIHEILQSCSQAVCQKALERIEGIYNNLEDYEYLLVTGGTGAAWLGYIQEHYKDMHTLQVITANQNENLPPIYSNVRGYYIYRVLRILSGR